MATLELSGKTVEVDAEGFLVKPEDWTESMAPVLAEKVEIFELTDDHWKVIRFMRQDFQENGQIPTVRRLKNVGGIPTKDLYRLFPQGPAKKAAFISGLGKPQGCV